MLKFLAFLKKEFIQISRDRLSLVVLFLMPVLLVLLFGFAITNDIHEARIGVFDSADDTLSRAIIQRLDASEYFDVRAHFSSIAEAGEALRRGDVKAVAVFPQGLAHAAVHDASAQMKVVLNAGDPNESANLAEYMRAIALAETLERFGQTHEYPRIGSSPQLLYNPQLKSAFEFVPGVMGLILFLICTLMTSVGIVREKEFGSMEVLLVSPVRPIYIIISKALPYFVLSLFIICVILGVAHFALGVPIRGSLALVFALSALYTLVALTLGVLVSTIANTQQTAMFVSTAFFMLPTVLLSGMVFPLENMPKILQALSFVVPAKWYIGALRDVMIKGVGLEVVAGDVGVLCLMTALLAALSLAKFKTRLE